MSERKPRSRKEAAVPLAERTYYCVLEECHKPFTPAKWNQNTCCPEHANEHALAKKRARGAEKEKQKHAERPCIIEECRKPFRPRNKTQLCCSPECSDLRKNRLAQQKRDERREFPPADVGSMPGTKLSVDQVKTDQLISEMHARGFFVTKEPEKTGERFDVPLPPMDGDRIKFGLMSDTHMCSRQQQLTHLNTFYKILEEHEIDTCFHCGDLCEGDGKQHKGQVYDLFVHGHDEQCDYVVEHYPRINGITTYFITGSHDYSFWKSAGYDFGRHVAEKREDMEYLGVFDAYVNISPNVDMNLHHPGGGTAYALSYNAQKKVESYPPELKPNVAAYGHYHRVFWMPAYRNVDTFLVPCFQSQTNFLKERKIYPIIGGFIMEAVVNEDGLVKTLPDCIRFYVPVEADY